MSRLLDINEAAEFLGVKVSWLRSAIRNNTVKFIKLNRLVRFKQEDLQEYIKMQTIHHSERSK